jgi:ABC-type phosphate/phosphonate transport system substrate-binding protein
MEAVLSPWHRARRVGRTRHLPLHDLDRGLTIRTRAGITAGTILAAAALAGCGGGSDSKSSSISDKFRNDYVAGCTSTGQTKAGCECIFDNLKDKQGIDTEAKFKAISDKVRSATQSGNLTALPGEFRSAVVACRSQIVKPPGA